MEKQTLATAATPQARGDEPEIIISTGALDRDHDEIVPEGGDFTAYRRNPVVLYGHDRGSLPVGSTTKLEVLPGRGVRARWRWLEGDEFAARVKNAFDQGVLRAASVGFLPRESEANGRGGRRFTRWELLEWSLVPIPANPGAVRVLRGLGLWHAKSDEVVLDLTDDEPVLEIDAAFAAALRQTARRHSEPFEPVYEVSAAEVRAALRGVLRETLAVIARDAAVAAVRRARGRVD